MGLTVNRQLNQAKLAVKSLYWNFCLVRNSSDFRLETLPVSKNISYLLILL